MKQPVIHVASPYDGAIGAVFPRIARPGRPVTHFQLIGFFGDARRVPAAGRRACSPDDPLLVVGSVRAKKTVSEKAICQGALHHAPCAQAQMVACYLFQVEAM
jgi:hypothetical protein